MKTENQQKCKNLSTNGDELDQGCQEAPTFGVLVGTDEEVVDFRKCPFDGDVQKCLDNLIELNGQGILWQNIPHQKRWFDDPKKVKRYIKVTDAVMRRDIAEARALKERINGFQQRKHSSNGENFRGTQKS